MIVVSPTDTWIRAALGNCRKSLRVASPFVGGYMQDRIAELPSETEVILLTRTLLTDFASQASDLEAVCGIASRGSSVFSLNALHAKVYIVDDTTALITSANATFSGMNRNVECGFEIKKRTDIANLREHLKLGFGSASVPKLWHTEELESLREPVALLRKALPRLPRVPSIADQPPLVRLKSKAFQKLIHGFSGWLRLTLEGIATIGKPEFSLNEVWVACALSARKEFPNNRFPQPKIRQQMQRLRDLGVVRFLGGGRYELLTRPTE